MGDIFQVEKYISHNLKLFESEDVLSRQKKKRGKRKKYFC